MSFYQYARKQWRNKDVDAELRKLWQQRLKEWRQQDRIKRIKRPTRISKARSLGYKPKPGVVLVRGRIRRGGRSRRSIRRGRRPKRAGRTKFTPKKSLKQIMEERISRKYPNLEVLNSYPVAKDGKHKWFEHILVDPSHPSIQEDDNYSWIEDQPGRAHRGKTSAGKRARGLNNKGKGAEKVRPSNRANNRQAN
ncbi:MAG: 50S ribosomal protein L15e [Candidatus Nanohaloarchaea archaeon]|nr:50S ribosomal protein L15e [Candidatus Nanohaloarchaea archaeon]